MEFQRSFTIFMTLVVSAFAVILPVVDVENDISEERDTFDAILRTQQNHRTYTPRKCCKVGMKAAEMELDCDISYNVVEERNNNIAYRLQMKPELSSAHGTRRLHYKNLLYSVEKCNPTKLTRSMFMKCCEYEKDLILAVESCDDLTVLEERQECRRLAGMRKR